MRNRFLVVGLAAAALGGGAAVWYAAPPDDATVQHAPSTGRDGWTGYASELELNTAVLDAKRAEGLEKILTGMRTYGARPEQIANVESKLDNLRE